MSGSSHYEPRKMVVRVGSRWAAVVYYGPNDGGCGRRSGYWCEDAAGGWGISQISAEEAVKWCERPRLYRTMRQAMKVVR